MDSANLLTRNEEAQMADNTLKDIGDNVRRQIDKHPSVAGGVVLGAIAGAVLPGSFLLWSAAGAALGVYRESQRKK